MKWYVSGNRIWLKKNHVYTQLYNSIHTSPTVNTDGEQDQLRGWDRIKNFDFYSSALLFNTN